MVVLIAMLPLIVYNSKGYSHPDSSTNHDSPTIIEKYHRHAFIIGEQPDYNYVFDEPQNMPSS